MLTSHPMPVALWSQSSYKLLSSKAKSWGCENNQGGEKPPCDSFLSKNKGISKKKMILL